MSNLSRRLFKEGLERAVQRGTTLIANREFDIGAAVHTLIDYVHPTSAATVDHSDDSDHHDRSLTETMFDIVRSVDSVHDLKDRITSHRGEFVDLARASRAELVKLLAKITESDGRNGHGGPTASLPPVGRSGAGDGAEGRPLTKDL